MPDQPDTIIHSSTASRLIRCPASWATARMLPEASSTDAGFDTRMHALMARHAKREPMPFHKMDHEQKQCFRATCDHLKDLFEDGWLADEGGELGFEVVGTAIEISITGVGRDATDAVDLVVASEAELHVIDYDFGSAPPVYALEDGSESARLMFLALGLLDGRPDLFTPMRDVYLSIIQPRTEVGLNTVYVTHDDIRSFRTKLAEAVGIATNTADPELFRGD